MARCRAKAPASLLHLFVSSRAALFARRCGHVAARTTTSRRAARPTSLAARCGGARHGGGAVRRWSTLARAGVTSALQARPASLLTRAHAPFCPSTTRWWPRWLMCRDSKRWDATMARATTVTAADISNVRVCLLCAGAQPLSSLLRGLAQSSGRARGGIEGTGRHGPRLSLQRDLHEAREDAKWPLL